MNAELPIDPPTKTESDQRADMLSDIGYIAAKLRWTIKEGQTAATATQVNLVLACISHACRNRYITGLASMAMRGQLGLIRDHATGVLKASPAWIGFGLDMVACFEKMLERAEEMV